MPSAFAGQQLLPPQQQQPGLPGAFSPHPMARPGAVHRSAAGGAHSGTSPPGGGDRVGKDGGGSMGVAEGFSPGLPMAWDSRPAHRPGRQLAPGTMTVLGGWPFLPP